MDAATISIPVGVTVTITVADPAGIDQPPSWAVDLAAQLAEVKGLLMSQSAQLQAVADMLAAFETDVEQAVDHLTQLAANPDDSTNLSPEAAGVLEQIKAGVAAARAALNLPEAPPASDTPIADATAEALASGQAGDAGAPAEASAEAASEPAASEPSSADLSTDGTLDAEPAPTEQ
jgi:hypothetical protein